MIRILVVVDVQKDFVDGALGSERAYSKAVPAVVEKIKENRKNGDWLIFTLDTHAEDYLQTFEGRKLPVVHCVKGTEGWNLDERIRELPEETFREKCLFIEKPGFGSTELISEIKKISDGEDFELEFCGLCTDICVATNVLSARAAFPGTVIKVYENACAGSTEEKHKDALSVMQACQIDIV